MSGQEPRKALTIAGSDSGGGAGIEADLKTFTALQVYGLAAVTSVTAQNTLGVTGMHDIPAAFVAKQIDVVLDDIGADAVKSGMLSSVEIVDAVAGCIEAHGITQYVLDPVMVSETGHPLLDANAMERVIARLFPLSLVVTPNLSEVEAILGRPIDDEDAMRAAAAEMHALGPRYVLIKGGHLSGPEAIDILYDGTTWVRHAVPRIDTRNTHGTGCTYSAAIAAHLARGVEVPEAVTLAKAYVTGALQSGFDLGGGAGSLNHFWSM